MSMTRGEWGLVGAMFLCSILCLTMISPPALSEAQTALSQIPLGKPAEVDVPVVLPPTPTPITPTPLPTVVPSPTPTPFPFDTHPEEERYIYIDQLQQHMYVFEHGVLVRDIPCSTGLPTPTTITEAWEGRVGEYRGTFRSFGVWADEAWFLYYSLGSILIHSLPYNYVGEVKAYEDWSTLGMRPSSHGCIRIAPEDARWLSEWNPEGVLITITEPYVEYWQNNDRPPTVVP